MSVVVKSLGELLFIYDLEEFPQNLVFWEDGECYPWLGECDDDGYEIPAWSRVKTPAKNLSPEQVKEITEKATYRFQNPVQKVLETPGHWETSGAGDGLRSKSQKRFWVEPEYTTVDYTESIGSMTLEEFIEHNLELAQGSNEFSQNFDSGFLINPEWIKELENSI